MNLLLLWLGAVRCINMWLICRLTEQSSPIKTLGYFAYSHIQEENSTSAVPRGFQYAQHLDVTVLFMEHIEIFYYLMPPF